jgi:RNase P subunit RPR2
MKELTCKKCDEKMMKKGIMQSGNSKYDVYHCNECGHEEMKAISVNPNYHR